MKKLNLKSFKAHKELEIIFDEKSFLLYGDNGAGKSSIYDALKIEFFRDKIEESIETSSFAEEVSQEDKHEFFRKYNNTNLNNDFEINLEKKTNIEYQIFMLNLEDTEFGNYLNLLKLIENIYFQIPDSFSSKYQEIETRANELLVYFKEDITIRIDNEDNYSIKITDEQRKLSDIKDIKRYFNEAKLNLVVFALLFSIIEIFEDEDKKRVLILDDFITSLDMSNRTFLMKYILETFGAFQMIILTHNVYFYNLIRYLINGIYEVGSQWKIANLYETVDNHKVYINPSNKIKKRLELNKLEEKLDALEEENIATLGNDFRQKFEILLYEFSKILMVGGVEETKNILETLIKQEKLYFFKDGNQLKGSLDLLSKIENIIESGNPDIDSIKAVIKKYSVNSFDEIQGVLRDLKLYQKVHMHHLSHGNIGDSNFSKKEAKETLLLLKKLEDNIFNLMHQEMAGS